MLVKDAKARKQRPIGTGVLGYFGDAIAEVAYVSYLGNLQHNGPDAPLHWDRSKSKDDYDALARHVTDAAKEDIDTDGGWHLAKAAWRALAALQKKLEERAEQVKQAADLNNADVKS